MLNELPPPPPVLMLHLTAMLLTLDWIMKRILSQMWSAVKHRFLSPPTGITATSLLGTSWCSLRTASFLDRAPSLFGTPSSPVLSFYQAFILTSILLSRMASVLEPSWITVLSRGSRVCHRTNMLIIRHLWSVMVTTHSTTPLLFGAQ
jgi:hypothetical protein